MPRLARSPLDSFPTAGPRVARFIETFCTLGASYLGQPFRLLPYQRALLDDIYRLDPVTRRRLRRTYLLGLPRKNGKSQIGAALALYHLIADKADSAPLVLSVAGDRKQARLVFDEARRMVLSNPDLKAACTVYRDVIRCHRNGGEYRVLSADAGLAQGYNPSCVIVDEYHVHKTDELFTAVTNGSGTRNEPLFIVISTAGFDMESPLGHLYSQGLRVSGHRLNGVPYSGELDDSSFGMEWWGPEPGEVVDWEDPGVWERFNPSWAIMNPEDFRAVARIMHESQFRRYRLNEWTSAEQAWLPFGLWESRDYRKVPGRTLLAPDDEVVLGFDGAWKHDSTALVATRIRDLHSEPIKFWEKTPGAGDDWRTPQKDVEQTIRDATRAYRVREIAADPYRWEQSLTMLAEEGLPVLEFPTNSVERAVKATTALYDVLVNGPFTHNGDAILARHVGNAILKEDARGGRITKDYKSSSRHIDGAIALMVAVYRAQMWREEAIAESQLIIL